MKTRIAHRSAFTLAELLVFIVILGILVWLMADAMNSVRWEKNRSLCASNLRQIGIALLAYASDNTMHLPSSRYANAGHLNWEVALCNGGYAATNIFRCPSDWVKRTVPGLIRSYGIALGTGGSETCYWIHGSRITCPYFTDPSQIALVAEVATAQGVMGGTPYAAPIFWDLATIRSPHGGETISDARGNYLFMDGHVAWLAETATVVSAIPAAPAGACPTPCP